MTLDLSQIQEPPAIKDKSNSEIKSLINILSNNIRIMKAEAFKVQSELTAFKQEISESSFKLDIYRNPPYLIASVVEVLEPSSYLEGLDMVLNKDKSIVIKTARHQTIFLPVVGLVPAADLKSNDLIGVNKDTYLTIQKLPDEYDLRVKSMMVDEKPREDYNDIGGISTQIEELQEAVVLPMLYPERFRRLGITPSRGVLLHGPPGTGKTLLAKAVANQTNAAFIKIAAPQLSQMYVGGGAKIVREAFKLAKSKSSCILFIDEIDAIGTTRSRTDGEGSNEVMRTLIELLNQLDGFSSDDRVKVIAATNRPDILDPALVRSGRIDRKIEFGMPDRVGRREILEIHSRKMKLRGEIDLDQISMACGDFNGSQLKAVCVEAGMLALKRGKKEITENDFVDAAWVVKDKKRKNFGYFI